MLAEQADDVQALLGRDQGAAVALDVADRDQPLDDRRARGGRADTRLLHRLAQLVVVDELAGGLHRAQQRGVAVAPRRFRFLARARDLDGAYGLVLLQPRQLLLGAVVLLALGAIGLYVRRDLVVDTTPAGLEQQLAVRAEHVRACRGPLGSAGRTGRAAHTGRAALAWTSSAPTVVSTRVFSNTASGGTRRGSGARPCRRCAGRRSPFCRGGAPSAWG